MKGTAIYKTLIYWVGVSALVVSSMVMGCLSCEWRSFFLLRRGACVGHCR